MDTLNKYRKIIEKVLKNYINITYANGEIENEIILDRMNDRYLVMSLGWENVRRIHGCVVHIDIIDGLVWIQRDGTEDGIATELEQEGIPKNKIVLGFHEPDVRQHTGYAVA
ncbi:XisI protein domain-containing protein [Desulfonema limicola]|uniref:XisI protein domain-containing protein n=1 Tax=Desulfonema limicola TaxID=45656 RepID=A0A975GHJ7_9BACT|nr:XisI protein [Desulfonema limicola]QTA81477.1 XisI protein domain-containing protein [Desulfonema limicola]